LVRTSRGSFSFISGGGSIPIRIIKVSTKPICWLKYFFPDSESSIKRFSLNFSEGCKMFVLMRISRGWLIFSNIRLSMIGATSLATCLKSEGKTTSDKIEQSFNFWKMRSFSSAWKAWKSLIMTSSFSSKLGRLMMVYCCWVFNWWISSRLESTKTKLYSALLNKSAINPRPIFPAPLTELFLTVIK